MERTPIVAMGGNSAHIPEHTVEACVAAYTAGADWQWIQVQVSRDGVPVLFGHPDLSATTTGSGPVHEKSLTELRALSVGARFKPGGDLPWAGTTNRKGGVIPKARMATLEEVWMRLGRLTGWFVDVLAPDAASWEASVAQVRALAERFGERRLVLVSSDRERARILSAQGTSGLVLSDDRPSPEVVAWCGREGIRYLLLSAGPTARELAATAAGSGVEVVLAFGDDVPPDAAALPCAVAGRSVLALADVLRGRCEVFSDDFVGNRIDREKWIAGISSGHELQSSLIARRIGYNMLGTGLQNLLQSVYDSRIASEATVGQDNGLYVDITRGTHYASAGVISVVSVPDPFQLQVDFTFENPQTANMMVLAVTNITVFDRFHQEGIVSNPRAHMENPIFDTHGMSPYVSMEREEADGFRIMHNDGPDGLIEWYGNVYSPDVGSGASRRGRFMLERRGHLFSGYYQDEQNPCWIGVGFVECSSMNERVYVRLASKHYPKAEQRDPLFANHSSYQHFRATTFCQSD
jgi:glycerophosphoryl diester phosphodiesterase